MADMITRRGDIGDRTNGFAVRKLLENGQHLLVLERFGQVDPQGKNKTLTRRYRKYNPLTRATAPLAEAITPAGQKLTSSDITCTLQQFGDVVWISDVILDTHEDPVLDAAVKEMTVQVAETIEVVRYAVLKAGSNVFFPGTVTTRATVAAPIDKPTIRRVIRAFARNKATKFTEIIGATAKVSTMPVPAAFFGVCHTDMEDDIKAIPGFIPVEQYADHMKAIPGEFGSVAGVRFCSSGLCEPWLTAGASGTTMLSDGSAPAASAACDVYPILIFAKNAYGLVPLQGMNSVHINVVNPKAQIGDELGQRGFCSWKTYQATIILQQLWMARVECACTAVPPT